VRLIVARCSVEYSGRLSARLPEALRLLMIKSDGSVLVHADCGGYKPLNWMTPPTAIEEDAESIVVRKVKGEDRLDIRLIEVLSDSEHSMEIDGGLQKDGVERHLQELLADRCTVLGEGWSLVRREYPTDIGPVDLLCRDEQGAYVAVEIKRRGEIDGLEQLGRYLERLRPALGTVRGVLAAQAFTQQARTLAAARGINCVPLDYDALRGIEPNTPTLF